MKLFTVLALLATILLTPSIAKAQGTVGTNTNGTSAAMNAPKPNAPAPAAHVATDGKGSGATSGQNDGSYVESTFVNYKDALAEGERQKTEQAKPKTLADLAREAREKKTAEQKAKATVATTPKAKQ
jgi:hypothetical protein